MTHRDDVILTQLPSHGSAGGPAVALDQIYLGSGYRKTNLRHSQKLRRYSLTWPARAVDTAIAILTTYEALEGPQDSFLMTDPNDWNTGAFQGELTAAVITAFQQPLRNTVTGLYVGDGSTTTFQMMKLYSAGSAAKHYRVIVKPKTGTVRVGVNAVEQTLTVNFSFSTATGIVTFVVAPANGLSTTWGGEFYTPVAFEETDFELEAIEGENRGGEAVLREVKL